jgi:hypothetical protein
MEAARRSPRGTATARLDGYGLNVWEYGGMMHSVDLAAQPAGLDGADLVDWLAVP